jgi:hypothetical protein
MIAEAHDARTVVVPVTATLLVPFRPGRTLAPSLLTLLVAFGPGRSLGTLRAFGPLCPFWTL